MNGDRGESVVWDDLVKWVEGKGGIIHKSLELRGSDSSNRGVFSKTRIPRGELLIQLPVDCALSGKDFPKSWKDENCSEKYASPWLRCLASYYKERLCQSKGSPFKEYFESLPKEYDSIINWSQEDIQIYLAGTTLGSHALMDRSDGSLDARYDVAVKPFLKLMSCAPTLSDPLAEMNMFREACMVLSTRGFHLENKSAQGSSEPADYDGPYLLPIIDLLNHEPARSCTTLRQELKSGLFYMETERDLEAGEEVYHSYGSNLTSAQLLQTFGFVPVSRMKALISSDESEKLTKEALTTASLTKLDIRKACQSIADSSVAVDLAESLKNSEAEVWALPSLSPMDRPLAHISEDIVLPPCTPRLSDELLTVSVSYFLPPEIFDEIFESGETILDSSVLNDEYLAMLACQSIVAMCDAKLLNYTNEYERGLSGTLDPLSGVRAYQMLQTRLREIVASGAASSPEACGTAIRLEEARSVESLRREALMIQECVRAGYEVQSAYSIEDLDLTQPQSQKRRKVE